MKDKVLKAERNQKPLLVIPTEWCRPLRNKQVISFVLDKCLNGEPEQFAIDRLKCLVC